FSLLLRPRLHPLAATQLTIAAATAVLRALRNHTGVLADIKWPNDILVAGRKIVGILTEMSAELDTVKYIILGIGVDVNLNASDLPADLRKLAASVKIETGQSWNRAELAAAILRELDSDFARIAAGRFDEVADEWESHCSTIGQN